MYHVCVCNGRVVKHLLRVVTSWTPYWPGGNKLGKRRDGREELGHLGFGNSGANKEFKKLKRLKLFEQCQLLVNDQNDHQIWCYWKDGHTFCKNKLFKKLFYRVFNGATVFSISYLVHLQIFKIKEKNILTPKISMHDIALVSVMFGQFLKVVILHFKQCHLV